MSVPRQLGDGINLGLEEVKISSSISVEDELTNIIAQKKAELEVFFVRTLQREIGPDTVPLVRKFVSELFECLQEKLTTSIKCNFANQAHTSESRNLKLMFLDKISLPVYTGRKIEGEGCKSITVALVDELTGQIVNSGPEATSKFEIEVLDPGYSGGNGVDNHNFEDFNNKIVRERKGKKTMLQGITCLNLKEGICNIDELSFTHNSVWMKSSELCLGARPVDNFPGITIKAAKTESFILKDRRNTLYGKRDTPLLCDNVWRLKKINKKGAFCKRLSRENIYTVKDFLKLFFTNPQKLQKILRADAKTWEVITGHARTCQIDEELYPSSQRKTGVVFNVVGEVKGLLGESQYFPTEMLSEKEKKDAQKSVIPAFEHWEEVIPFNDETSLMEGSSHSSESPRPESPNGGNQGDPPLINAYDHTQSGTSSHGIISSINCIGESSWLDASLGDDKLIDTDCPIYSPDCIHDFDEHEHLLNNNSNHQPEGLNLDLQAERRWAMFFFDCPVYSLDSIHDFDEPERLLNNNSNHQPESLSLDLWAMVFFVLKWFRIRRRIGALERDHVQKKQRIS